MPAIRISGDGDRSVAGKGNGEETECMAATTPGGGAGCRPPHPDFLVVRAQQAGTTNRHHLLCIHPRIILPPGKGLQHFSLPPPRLLTSRRRWRASGVVVMLRERWSARSLSNFMPDIMGSRHCRSQNQAAPSREVRVRARRKVSKRQESRVIKGKRPPAEKRYRHARTPARAGDKKRAPEWGPFAGDPEKLICEQKRSGRDHPCIEDSEGGDRPSRGREGHCWLGDVTAV